ncbi:MAG TPA: DUF1571 domain-containing protein [Planctomycetaceae bacterium]|nr:DUF1571 domain-containing protein [Planctomycetaceae bacterium]
MVRRSDVGLLSRNVMSLSALFAGAVILMTSSAVAQDAVTASKSAIKVDPQHPLVPALEHAYAARQKLAAVADYEAVFSKQEHIGRRMRATSMKMKVREEPFSVYLHYVTPHAGREVIYVAGRNNGMLLAHEAGLKSIAGTVPLAPDSEDAMDGNKYPVTMIGMKNLLEQIITQWEAESQFGESVVQYRPDSKLGGVPCKVIETSHPTPRKQFKFQMTRLFIDEQTGLPIRVEQYAFPQTPEGKPPLIEEYTYTKIRTNIGLTDRDFDVANPNYAFP